MHRNPIVYSWLCVALLFFIGHNLFTSTEAKLQESQPKGPTRPANIKFFENCEIQPLFYLDHFGDCILGVYLFIILLFPSRRLSRRVAAISKALKPRPRLWRMYSPILIDQNEVFQIGGIRDPIFALHGSISGVLPSLGLSIRHRSDIHRLP